jgi:hypothetical protein
MNLRQHTEERLNREWSELYDRMKSLLLQYGEDDIDDGDYYLVDENFGRYTHQVEFHRLHMLRPEIIKALQSLLAGYPDWEIEVSVRIPEENIRIEPGEALTLHDDEIIDALDRGLLPEKYRDLKYQGSQRPRRPSDVRLPGDE